MNQSNPQLDGGGPFRLKNDDPINPGDVYRWPINSPQYRYNGRKGFFRQYLPFDTALLKNFNTSNTAVFTFNGEFEAEVEQNAADTFSEAGITRVAVENIGSGTIDPGELLVQVKRDKYGADEAARAEAERSPLESIARNWIGL